MLRRKQLFLLMFLFPMITYCLSFNLPANGDDIVGNIQTVMFLPGQNFHDVGRRYDIGFDAMVAANPKVNPLGVKKPTMIVIPSMFVLPPGPRQGIIVNIGEERLYYFPPNQNVVYTFPIGVGL